VIAYTVPLFLRGRVITDDLVQFDTRIGAAQFQAPDMGKYVAQLPLKSPAEMSDLYELSFDEILDVLGALGNALDFESNTHLQEAYRCFPGTMSPKSPTARSGWTISTDGSCTSCATVANYGCAPSDPACCTSRRVTADWSRR
jgi:hypothetical protein